MGLSVDLFEKLSFFVFVSRDQMTSSPNDSRNYNSPVWNDNQTNKLMSYIHKCEQTGEMPRFCFAGFTNGFHNKSKEICFVQYKHLVETGKLARPFNYDEICSQAEIDVRKGSSGSQKMRYLPTPQEAFQNIEYILANLHQSTTSQQISELCSQINEECQFGLLSDYDIIVELHQRFVTVCGNYRNLTERYSANKIHEQTVATLERTIDNLRSEKQYLQTCNENYNATLAGYVKLEEEVNHLREVTQLQQEKINQLSSRSDEAPTEELSTKQLRILLEKKDREILELRNSLAESKRVEGIIGEVLKQQRVIRKKLNTS